MRVLVSSTPNYGHLHPLLPFARALADAGHEVAVAAPAALAGAVAHAGFRHLPAGDDRDVSDVFPELRALRGQSAWPSWGGRSSPACGRT